MFIKIVGVTLVCLAKLAILDLASISKPNNDDSAVKFLNIIGQNVRLKNAGLYKRT